MGHSYERARNWYTFNVAQVGTEGPSMSRNGAPVGRDMGGSCRWGCSGPLRPSSALGTLTKPFSYIQSNQFCSLFFCWISLIFSTAFAAGYVLQKSLGPQCSQLHRDNGRICMPSLAVCQGASGRHFHLLMFLASFLLQLFLSSENSLEFQSESRPWCKSKSPSATS